MIFLHVVPASSIPEHPTRELLNVREPVRMVYLRQLQQLLPNQNELAVPPDFNVQFGLPSVKILQVALELKFDLIFMGLRHSSHVATASHMPWATAYDVVCNAGCPVLTVRSNELIPRPQKNPIPDTKR